ncbi:SH3 domain-containing protein like [Verticillium longisporum]|uniref:SH3 domain-containing protein like n=1 Tax=Verticillium longisporum TaxID=100787 RepID=A0A8I3AR49_VERLO|nr:SH3 domain-containing protein like [Verticillium longisporum]
MSSNPEKPPLSGQAPNQNQEPYYPTPAASGLPPAGFGQPTHPSQQPQQTQQSDLPPAYPSNEQHAAPTEKGAAVPASQTAQQNAPYFPPPPPGPPPTHTDTGLSAASSNPSQFYKSSNDYEGPAPPLPGPRPSQQGVHDEKTVPAYNPAQPHFAPPPGQAATATAGDHHHQHQQPPAYATNAPSSAAPGAVAADGKKPHRSWGDRLAQMGSKAAIPINALANKMGSQSFLPTTMDRECEKAAQILKSFCKEGITSDHVEEKPLHEATPVDPKNKEKEKAPRKRTGAIVKIPSKVIAKAQGLAIFTTARVGFQFSGATGSGVLIARRADGSWSPPSGIQVHALGAGFMIGVDIYDCVCVINTQEALKAFMSTRVSLGPDVAVTAGPYGAGGVLDFGTGYSGGRKSDEQQRLAEEQAAQKKAEEEKLQAEGLKPGEKPGNQRRSSSRSFKPVFTYVKSRGFYAGIQVDGTIITERREANAAFYQQQQVSVEQILRGDVPPTGAWMAGSRALYDALRVAETQQPLPEANLPPPAPVPAEPQVAHGPIATGQTPVVGSQYGGPPHMSGAGGDQKVQYQ